MELAEINKEKEKFYKSEQKKIDSNPKYRDKIIKIREETYARVNKTGCFNAIDDYYMNTFFMTLTPKQRKGFFDYWATKSIFEI